MSLVPNVEKGSLFRDSALLGGAWVTDSVGTRLWEMARKCGTRVHCQRMASSVVLIKKIALSVPCYLWNPIPLTI